MFPLIDWELRSRKDQRKFVLCNLENKFDKKRRNLYEYYVMVR